MKKLLPLVIALLGLGAGVGAGLALKPAPEEHATGCAAPEPAPAGAEATEGAETGHEGAAGCVPGEADPLDALVLETQLPGHHLAEHADRLAVLGGTRVALVERLGEAEHGRQLGLALDVAAARNGPYRGGHLRGVDDGPVSAQGLGGVQRLVGVGDELGGGLGVSGEGGDSDRRGDVSAAIDHTAWQVAGTFVLTGEPVTERALVFRTQLSF